MKSLTLTWYLSFFLCLASYSVSSQSLNSNWISQIGGFANEEEIKLSVDPSGNIIVVGTFILSMEFNQGSSIDSLTSNGNKDIFIMKLDAFGGRIWLKQVGGSSADFISSLDIDDNGNIYLGGEFSGTCDFDPGPNTFDLTSNGSQDIFILKLNPSGQFQWARHFGGNSREKLTSLEAGTNDRISFNGYFSGTADFDPGPGQYLLVSQGPDDHFIAQINKNGEFQFAKEFGNASSQIGIGGFIKTVMTTDHDGNIYLSGNFGGMLDVFPGQGVFFLTSTAFTDAFLLKLDSLGNFQWAKQYEGTEDQLPLGLHVGKDDLLYAYGNFSDAVDFALDTNYFILTADPANPWNPFDPFENYIAVSTLDGDLVNAFKIGGLDFEGVFEMEVETNGDLFFAGNFIDTCDFDPGPGVSRLISNGAKDFVLGKLNLLQGFEYVYQFGGIDIDRITGFTLDGGLLYQCGIFGSAVDFQPGPGSQFLSSSGGGDYFIQSLSLLSDLKQTKQGNFKIYPNPSQDFIDIDLGPYPATIRITDINGKTIYSNLKYPLEQIRIDLPKESGVYIVQIQKGDDEMITRKIVKE